MSYVLYATCQWKTDADGVLASIASQIDRAIGERTTGSFGVWVTLPTGSSQSDTKLLEGKTE